jgi:hypothetical protein
MIFIFCSSEIFPDRDHCSFFAILHRHNGSYEGMLYGLCIDELVLEKQNLTE